MARIALDRSMSAQEWKSVLMIADGLYVRPPAARCVAGLAYRSHLAHMDIGMAVRAATLDLLECEIRMATPARHLLVQAAQREPRGLVLKIGSRTEGTPTR